MLSNEIRKALRNLQSGEELQQLLCSEAFTDLALRDVDSIARAHRKLNHTHDCKIAYLGNHTIEPLDRFVEACSLIQGISVSSYLGEYDQHFQEVLDQNSGCRAFKPDIIFLSLSLRILSPAIFYDLLCLTTEQRSAEMQRILALLSDWIDLAVKQTDATLIVSNFQRPAPTQAGIADTRLELGEAELYSRLNLELQQLCNETSRALLFDMDHVLSCTGKYGAMDPKMYYLAKMEWSEQGLTAIARETLRHLTASLGRTKKCLVVDLDNTLWGGIVGEDGIDGLEIGKGSAAGEAFLDFQRAIRALKTRGILLAISSKNNPQDAEQVFLNREEMLLKLDDFAAVQINWDHKHINLQRIATDLNIGTDSLVFIDDNPVECALVREMLPEVTTIELPADPSAYPSLLQNLPLFEKMLVTAEDRQKTAQYAQNSQRAALKREISDMDSFLESLGTEVSIGTAKDKHKARVHQLFTKTNQFNLTTQRYSLAEIETFIHSPEWDIQIAQVKDNFGDMGIVGLYLVSRNGGKVSIDSFILSCRAMGRGIESAMMNKLKEDYLIKGQFNQLAASYLPTDKNTPARDFYPDEGFEIASEQASGKIKYIINSRDVQYTRCTGITVRSL